MISQPGCHWEIIGFPKSILQSITQLHSPTQEGAEISREKPKCCCIPWHPPGLCPALQGGGEAHRAQALHLRWLSCSLCSGL